MYYGHDTIEPLHPIVFNFPIRAPFPSPNRASICSILIFVWSHPSVDTFFFSFFFCCFYSLVGWLVGCWRCRYQIALSNNVIVHCTHLFYVDCTSNICTDTFVVGVLLMFFNVNAFEIKDHFQHWCNWCNKYQLYQLVAWFGLSCCSNVNSTHTKNYPQKNWENKKRGRKWRENGRTESKHWFQGSNITVCLNWNERKPRKYFWYLKVRCCLWDFQINGHKIKHTKIQLSKMYIPLQS